MTNPILIDDGTLDTVFKYRGREFRYCSEYINNCGGPEQFLKFESNQIIDEWFETVPDEFKPAIKNVMRVGSCEAADMGDTRFDMYAATICMDALNECGYTGELSDIDDDTKIALAYIIAPPFDNTRGHDCCGGTFASHGDIIHIDAIYNRLIIEQNVQRNI